jgi:hypothetical protein
MEGTNMILSESKSMRRAVLRCSAIVIGLMAAQMAAAVWAAPAPRTPKPVASAVAYNGNVVEFYDAGDRVLVSEIGAAYSNPAFDPQGKSEDRLSDIWRSVAPNKPFPQALAQLETHMDAVRKLGLSDHKNALPPPPVFESRPEPARIGGRLMSESSTPKSGTVTTSALEGCNNGCCDRAWLSTFTQCQGGTVDGWFLFNYGSTWATSGNIINYSGLVCSANGTSRYSVNIGTNHWWWDVPPATYRTFWWYAANLLWCGGFCPADMTSYVNNPSTPHLHTYCGWVLH